MSRLPIPEERNMQCRDFEDRLESWFGLSLDQTLQDECSAHVAECSHCAELVALMEISSGGRESRAASGTVVVSGTSGPSDVSELSSATAADLLPPDFLVDVLKATSGFPCPGIEERLVEETWDSDGLNPSLTSPLSPRLREHLASCRPCRGLEAALSELRRELPTLATIPVDAAFTESILRRTLPPRQRFARWSRAFGRRWLARPRFATELAYALTVLLMVLVGNPSAPLRALSERSEGLVPSERLESELKSVATSVQATPAWGAIEDSLRWTDGRWNAGRETVRSVLVGGAAFGQSLLHALAPGDDPPVE
ncbi:MAG: hypothetical protein K8J08_00270 [Thermoanaerobaculia bacterium]|nr:hypothetical protein [Thermoanaerobaculia bacterium]